jgi:positive regulator of sigma E activity
MSNMFGFCCMKYKEKEALIGSIGKESLTVFVPCESVSKCRGCAKYGICGSAGGWTAAYIIPVDNPEKYKEKETVTVNVPQPAFPASLFFVFILPILLMVLFPALLVAIGGNNSAGDLKIITAGFAGAAAGFFIGRIADRRFSRKYPALIRDRKSGKA